MGNRCWMSRCHEFFLLAQLNRTLGRRERHLMEATPSGGEKSLRSTWPVQWLLC
uniref:Uncharacterized protein n=1 Tax=Setaria viridis TaxID=4556 RepID=A0A4U6UFT9_SETVI|nr:hypothetical protein SEVIR_5G120366v2 [Setaria viridis]